MIAIIIYILTVIYFSHTIYVYLTCYEPPSTKYRSCFDKGAEAFLSLIDSKEYDFH